MDTTTNTTTTPDLSFYFALHRHMRADLVRYVDTVAALTPADRTPGSRPSCGGSRASSSSWRSTTTSEDEFFFPEMRARIPAVADVLDRLDADHKAMDVLLARWPALMRDLADPKAPFEPAKAAALEMGTELRDLSHAHLDVEDNDILPMYWRHYTAEEYDAIQQPAIKKGKKQGFAFIAPWCVESVEGAEREAFLASVPGVAAALPPPGPAPLRPPDRRRLRPSSGGGSSRATRRAAPRRRPGRRPRPCAGPTSASGAPAAAGAGGRVPPLAGRRAAAAPSTSWARRRIDRGVAARAQVAARRLERRPPGR